MCLHLYDECVCICMLSVYAGVASLPVLCLCTCYICCVFERAARNVCLSISCLVGCWCITRLTACCNLARVAKLC